MVVAVVAAGLAVDLGTLAQEARRNQLVADLAALDAVRLLPSDPTPAAEASATRNDFPFAGPDHDIVVEWAPTIGGPFTSSPSELPAATAVRVTATSVHNNTFALVSDEKTVSRRAVSRIRPEAGFTIGSSLVNLDSASSTLLNPLIGQALNGSVNLSLVSWQGLADGAIQLSALQTELANLGFSVGTVEELLSARLTAAELFWATANALELQGDTANASVMEELRLAATSSFQMTLGDLLHVEQGSESTALGAGLNLFQLVTGTALVVNGTNTLSLSDAGITVPGVLSTGIELHVTELPQTYIGPIGGSVSTGQVELTVTPDVEVDVSIDGTVLRVTGDLPVSLELAGATGTLSGADCSGIAVTADPHAFQGQAELTTLTASTLLGIALLEMDVTSFTPSIDGPAQDLTFTYPSEFSPPAFSKHVGSRPIGLEGLTTFTVGDVRVLDLASLNLLGLTEEQVVEAVLAILPELIGDVDEEVLTPLIAALGLDIGGADVTALLDALRCDLPALAG